MKPHDDTGWHLLGTFRRDRRALCAMTLWVAGSTAACSSDDGERRGPCTALEPEGALVSLATENGSEPAPATGGAIVEGAYELGSVSVYAPSGTLVVSFCSAFSGVLELREGRVESALGCYTDEEDEASLAQRALNSGTFRASGSELAFDYTCPRNEVELYDYSADAMSLRTVAPDPNDPELTIELVWRLR